MDDFEVRFSRIEQKCEDLAKQIEHNKQDVNAINSALIARLDIASKQGKINISFESLYIGQMLLFIKNKFLRVLKRV